MPEEYVADLLHKCSIVAVFTMRGIKNNQALAVGKLRRRRAARPLVLAGLQQMRDRAPAQPFDIFDRDDEEFCILCQREWIKPLIVKSQARKLPKAQGAYFLMTAFLSGRQLVGIHDLNAEARTK